MESEDNDDKIDLNKRNLVKKLEDRLIVLYGQPNLTRSEVKEAITKMLKIIMINKELGQEGKQWTR